MTKVRPRTLAAAHREIDLLKNRVRVQQRRLTICENRLQGCETAAKHARDEMTAIQEISSSIREDLERFRGEIAGNLASHRKRQR